MASSLEELREDLILRWKAAFDRAAEVEAKPKGVLETVYTEYPAFELSALTYSPKAFKAGVRVAKKPSGEPGGWAFELDREGRPQLVRHPKRGRAAWRGFFRYWETEVEAVEFCIRTGVPSQYGRLVLEGGVVIAEQHFTCNEGGASDALKDGAPADKISRVLGDPSEYFISVVRYESDGARVVSGEEHREVSGERHRIELEYEYEGDRIDRVVEVWPNGERRTIFAAKGGSRSSR